MKKLPVDETHADQMRETAGILKVALERNQSAQSELELKQRFAEQAELLKAQMRRLSELEGNQQQNKEDIIAHLEQHISNLVKGPAEELKRILLDQSHAVHSAAQSVEMKRPILEQIDQMVASRVTAHQASKDQTISTQLKIIADRMDVVVSTLKDAEFKLSQVMLRLSGLEAQMAKIDIRLDNHQNRLQRITSDIDRLRATHEGHAAEGVAVSSSSVTQRARSQYRG